MLNAWSCYLKLSIINLPLGPLNWCTLYGSANGTMLVGLSLLKNIPWALLWLAITAVGLMWRRKTRTWKLLDWSLDLPLTGCHYEPNFSPSSEATKLTKLYMYCILATVTHKLLIWLLELFYFIALHKTTFMHFLQLLQVFLKIMYGLIILYIFMSQLMRNINANNEIPVINLMI